MKFGVPSQRVTKKAELFPNIPVLTIGIDGGKGTSRTMQLNSKAVEALGLGEVSSVAFGFDEKQVFITNGNQPGIPEEHQIRVTKGNPRKISEKRTYTYISEKVYDLDNSIENHFELVEVEDETATIKTFELVPMVAKAEVVEPDGEVIESKKEAKFEVEEVEFEVEEALSADSFTEKTV